MPIFEVAGIIELEASVTVEAETEEEAYELACDGLSGVLDVWNNPSRSQFQPSDGPLSDFIEQID